MTAVGETSPELGLVAGQLPFSAVDGPGNRYVVFLQGCAFDCLVCHNPTTIPVAPSDLDPTSVDDVVAGVRDAAPFLTGVTVTGGEATGQPRFVHALLSALAADPGTAGLSRFLDTNGDADPWVWDLLAPLLDGVMVDLKALDDDMHVVLTGASNTRVLASIERLAGDGLLAEVRLLLVPGLNDGRAALRATAEWLVRTAPGVPVRVVGYSPHGTRECARGLLVPRPDDLALYRHVLARAGVPVLD